MNTRQHFELAERLYATKTGGASKSVHEAAEHSAALLFASISQCPLIVDVWDRAVSAACYSATPDPRVSSQVRSHSSLA
jgi:hypothetical protein